LYCPYISNQIENQNSLIPSLIAYNHQRYLQEQAKSYLDDETQEEQKDAINWSKTIRSAFEEETANAKKQMLSINAAKALGSSQLDDSSFQRAAKFTQKKADTAKMITEEGNVIEINERGVITTQETEEEIEVKRKEELETLRQKAQQLKDRLAKMKTEIEKTTRIIQTKRNTVRRIEKKTTVLESDQSTKAKTLELLPKADEHIQKLEDIVSKSTIKLEDARAKWEEKKKKTIFIRT